MASSLYIDTLIQDASTEYIPGAITMAKRLRTNEGNKDLHGTSPATRFNSLIINNLKRALLADASVDLLTLFPTEYSTRLARMKNYQDGEYSCFPCLPTC